MTVVRRFDRNTEGRDFVLGDVHGCFDQLQAALDRCGFRPERDRVFAVGDLIDRGPRSADSLEWVEKSWFHSCLGNHEEMLLAATDAEELLLWLLLNGGEWWLELDEATRAQFISAFAQLPLAMEVDTEWGRVGLVHADVPEHVSWPAFVAALESGDPHAREAALWSRRRADGLVQTPVDGIDRVVCGHTINADAQVRVIGNVWLIDTGAFLSEIHGRLTLLPVQELFTQRSSRCAGEAVG